jgi:microcompartment protein CcmL/EutN
MDALGMIETRGMVACIEAADAAVKSANVRIVGYEKVGTGLVTVLFRGDVAACRASCDAGGAAAQKVGELVAVHVIAQPHPDLEGKMPISLPETLARGRK